MTIFATQEFESSNVIGTKTGVKWVIESLEEKNVEFKVARGDDKVTKIDAVDVSGGKGFASKVYKLTIHFDDASKEPYLSILKIPGLKPLDGQQQNENDEEEKEMLGGNTVYNCHNRECHFYSTFTEIPGLKIVKCYGIREWIQGKQEGALLMDYISSHSVNVDFLYGLNIHQARSCIKEVLKLQSYFFSLPNQEWQNGYKTILDVDVYEVISAMIPTNWAKVREYVPNELYKDYEVEILNLIDNFCKVVQFILHDIVNIEGNMKSFNHGDLWINNMMFKKGEDGQGSNEMGVIIDWQLTYVGSIGVEIARAIVIGCAPEIRREIETVDLPLYYKNLKNEVIERGGQFEMSWEMFKLNYDYCAINESLNLLMMVFMGLDNSIPDEAGDYLGDARKYAIGSRIIFALIDAVKKCRVLKPEWLVNKVKE